jgi:hypothetical protein
LVRLLWFLGYPEQAAYYSHRALVLARDVGHPFSSTLAATFAALAAQLRREEAKAIAAADAAHKGGTRFYEAELYRLKGELLLAREIKRQKSDNPNPQSQSLERFTLE